jgi:hypothetical protein
VHQAGQTVHLDPQARGDHLGGGLGRDLGVRFRRPGQPLLETAQSGITTGIVEDATHTPEGVVARGPGAGEVPGQLFLALEDLLDHGPGAPGGLVQTAQVATRVRETVGMVDPEAVDHALLVQVQQQGVGPLEDVGQLHPDRRERVHVEEAPVVQLVVGDLPVGESPPLTFEQVGESQTLGPRGHREDVVEVPHHVFLAQGAVRLRDLVDPHGDLPIGEDRADGAPEYRDEDRTFRGGVHVEPGGERRGGAIPEDRPQGVIVPDRGGDGHVVGDHVHHQAHAVGVGGLRERA